MNITLGIIPPQYYHTVYIYTFMVLLFFSVLKLLSDKKSINLKEDRGFSTIILMVSITLFIGLRPISGYFGDMTVYYQRFLDYANSYFTTLTLEKDIFWQYFLMYSARNIQASTFFFICAVLYIYPIYLACKNWFGRNSFFPFFMFVVSFSFFAYGTNGIRNGIATSFVLLAISFKKELSFKKISLLILALGIHLSAIIPVIAIILTRFHKKTKNYLIAWVIAIPLSLAFGGFWQSLFASLGFKDKRVSYFTEQVQSGLFSSTGFRWDFLIYSATAVYAGYFFVFKRKFNDRVYLSLLNIYLTTNAFWILVIRANFSNRFAYLSWFMIAIVIFYPFFKQRFFKNQNQVLARVLFLYFGFTFLMYIIS